MGGAYSDFALPIDRPTCHSQVPVSFSSHLHLEEGSLQFIAKNADSPSIRVIYGVYGVYIGLVLTLDIKVKLSPDFFPLTKATPITVYTQFTIISLLISTCSFNCFVF